tara:strand:+ start:2130 stop:2801 length:672 start_codon:yes stop_codon:yes gene_type:complete
MLNFKSTKRLVDIDLIVCDDFLEHYHFTMLKKSMADVDWEYRPGISIEDEGDPRLYYGFSCGILDKLDGPKNYDMELRYHKLIAGLNERVMRLFNFDSTSRCRLDMTTYRGPEPLVFAPHVDLDGEHYTSIFYIEESDAPTIIYNEMLMEGDVPKDMELTEKQRIEPKPNRLVVFKGNYVHTGMCPTTTANRILVNSNFRRFDPDAVVESSDDQYDDYDYDDA